MTALPASPMLNASSEMGIHFVDVFRATRCLKAESHASTSMSASLIPVDQVPFAKTQLDHLFASVQLEQVEIPPKAAVEPMLWSAWLMATVERERPAFPTDAFVEEDMTATLTQAVVLTSTSVWTLPSPFVASTPFAATCLAVMIAPAPMASMATHS